MPVVSDTTPLRYLIAIGRVDLLRRVFEEVWIPTAVLRELNAGATPPNVRKWMAQLPEWLRVRDPHHPRLRGATKLGPGETATIRLALESGAELVLMDDREARKWASGFGLKTVGTLGLLEIGDEMGFLTDFPAVLAELEASGFYISPALNRTLLLRHGARNR